MRESQKGDKGDHRTISEPIPERKDFIKHIKENVPKENSEDSTKNTEKK